MSRAEPQDPRYKIQGFREAHLEVCKAYRAIDKSKWHRLRQVEQAALFDDHANDLMMRYYAAMAKRRKVVAAAKVPKERHCRVCGCTEFSACQTPEGPCHWVEEDLCSACSGKKGAK